MRVGEGRLIGGKCVRCIWQFHYYPHPYCYNDECPNNNPIVYKPCPMGQELKSKDETESNYTKH